MSIKFESAEGIARVTLAAPERRNALTPDEFAELNQLLATVAADPSERVVVLTGEGTAFCAGAFLPLGVSFFTFEFIHYAADRYNGKADRGPS